MDVSGQGDDLTGGRPQSDQGVLPPGRFNVVVQPGDVEHLEHDSVYVKGEKVCLTPVGRRRTYSLAKWLWD